MYTKCGRPLVAAIRGLFAALARGEALPMVMLAPLLAPAVLGRGQAQGG